MDGVVAKNKRKKNVLQKTVNNKNTQGFCEIDDNYNDESLYHIYQLGKAYESDELHIGHYDFVDDAQFDEFDDSNKKDMTMESMSYEEFDGEDYIQDAEESHTRFSLQDLPIFSHESVLIPRSITSRFAVVVGMFTLILGTFLFVGTTFAVANRVDGAGKRAITSIKIAVNSLRTNDFAVSGDSLDRAHQEFLFASAQMNKISSFATFISQFVPGASKLASGNHIIEAGKYLTHAAKEFHTIIPVVISEDSALVARDGEHVSFLALYKLVADRVDISYTDITQARKHIDKVYLSDVPKEYQDTFMQMKEVLPLVENSLRHGVESRNVVEELLGANGSRTYLFLFQNNHEMRATGGFIGSYGIVKINDGNIEKLIVDDIFNPDGQLIDRVVPPLPIQKISADWSLHDSNWFVDFPLSAKKAMDFYERTGGPTVDGVIAITPVMMEKFLAITGPIKLSEYDMMLTSENFMEIMQDEIEDEKNYKKENAYEENEDEEVAVDEVMEEIKKQPKKVLSDLMPIMIDKLSDRKTPEHLAKLLSAVSAGMKERHIIMYMTDDGAQDIIESNDWGGTVLQTDKDYLSVINTNINGFKTEVCKYKTDELVYKETWNRSPLEDTHIKVKYKSGNLKSHYKNITKYNPNHDWISEKVYKDDVLDEKTVREIEYY